MWYLVEPGRGRPAPGQALIEQETAPVYQKGTPTGTSATVLAASESTGLSEIGDGPVSVPVYTFSLDRGYRSACQGCVPCTGRPSSPLRTQAGAGVDRHGLGVIVRPDGTLQVTFDRHPLYLFHQDVPYPSLPPAYPISINGAGSRLSEVFRRRCPPVNAGERAKR